MTVYENYHIGSFIYSLGFRSALQAVESGVDVQNAALGLYQRERLDQPLADLLFGHGGKCVLIEFKARFKGLKAEHAKRVKSLLLADLRVADATLTARSALGHFLAVGAVGPDNVECMWFRAYESGMGSQNESDYLAIADSLDTYLNRLLEGEIGLDAALFKMYLKLFKKAVDIANREADDAAAASASGTSSGETPVKKRRRIADPIPSGLVMSIRPSGGIKLLPFLGIDVLHDLDLTLSTGLEQAQGLKRGIKRNTWGL